ncbi:MAG: hypothetical protein K2O41_02325 [Clostridia bacterium]|nr:hypothetical protein [Clostridia bacterium]
MEESKCCRCGNYEAYYTKAYCCFLKADYGYCQSRKETVFKFDGCKKFKGKRVNNRIKLGIVLSNLENALTNISVIKDFLEEKTEQ